VSPSGSNCRTRRFTSSASTLISAVIPSSPRLTSPATTTLPIFRADVAASIYQRALRSSASLPPVGPRP
jgi:hypothetical protein